jgi:arylsulfatase A-like enzyme
LENDVSIARVRRRPRVAWRACDSSKLAPSLRALAAAGLWLGLGAGCSEGGRPTPPHVVLISVDTLRADRLTIAGYERDTSPAIQRLADEGVVYTSAFATRGQTWPSLTSALTGLHPISHGVRSNGEMLGADVLALPQILKLEGYRTAAFLSNYGEAPNRGVDVMGPPRDGPQPEYAWDWTMTEAALAFLDERRDDQPFMLWLHLVSPHSPYQPPPDYAARFTRPDYDGEFDGSMQTLDEVVFGEREPTAADLEQINALYDGEVAFADFLVGRLLDKLDELGLTDDCLVVFFSDHGEELLDHHDYWYHGPSLYDATLKVPLVLRLPGGRSGGTRVDGLASLVDLVPTVLDVLDVPSPVEFDGRSLFEDGVPGATGRKHVFAEWAPGQGPPGRGEDPGTSARRKPQRIYSVRSETHKYIYNPAGLAPTNYPYGLRPGAGGFPYGEAELYDLRADPGETRNLADELPREAAGMVGQIKQWLDPSNRASVRSDAADADTMAKLRALGYLSADELNADGEEDPTDDEPTDADGTGEQADGARDPPDADG